MWRHPNISWRQALTLTITLTLTLALTLTLTLTQDLRYLHLVWRRYREFHQLLRPNPNPNPNPSPHRACV